MVTRANIYVAGLVLGSVLVAAYDAVIYARDLEPGLVATVVWPVLFLVLLISWVIEDSKARPVAYKPFDFGFLVFLFWIPFLPYYLWRTRGAKGLLMLLGFATLYWLDFIAEWVVHAAS